MLNSNVLVLNRSFMPVHVTSVKRAFTLVFSLIVWSIIKAAVGLRVEADTEMAGLDLGEMGMEAYGADPLA